MTYVGQQPATTFDSGIQDRFTGLSSNTVTLTHDISAETDILVVWNNIVQDSGTYSVGGTGNKTLTLGGTLSSGDVVTVYYTNKVMQSVNPTANSVGITELNLSDGSNGQAITTNGSGTLSFASAGTTINNNADNRVITGSGTANTLEGEANLTYDGTTLLAYVSDTGGGGNSNANGLVIEKNSHSGLTILSGNAHEGKVAFADADANNLGAISYDHSANAFFVATNGSNRMKIASDGDISIGTTSNEARLDTRYNANSGGFQIVNNKSSGCNSSTRVAVISGDQDSSGSYDLIHARNGGGHVFNVADSGNVQNTGNSYGSLSDNRIKQNITDASSQWDDIKNVKVKKYKLKKDVILNGEENTPYHLGVIAQDLETDNMSGLVDEGDPCPEDTTLHSDFGTVVDGTADNGAEPIKDEDGNITGYKKVFTPGQKVKAIKYSILYMKAIKALQEVQTRVETLETKVTALENA